MDIGLVEAAKEKLGIGPAGPSDGKPSFDITVGDDAKRLRR